MRTQALHDAVRRKPSDDWKAVLLEEHRMGQGRVAAPVEPPPVEEVKEAPKPRRKGDPLRNHAEYAELLHQLLDGPKQELGQRLVEDGFFVEAAREWRMELGWTQSNAPLFREAFRRLSQHMKAVYDFEPAWLGEPRKPFGKNCLAYYRADHDLVYLSPEVLGDHFPELLASIVHEQIHAYQWHVIDLYRSWQLTDPEMRAIAAYWLESERTRQWAVGAAYTSLGTEYHAYDVDAYAFWCVWSVAFPDLFPM